MPYILTNWLDIANTAPAGEIPPSVKISFYAGGAVFFGAVLWTVFKTHEYSPEELHEFDGTQETAKEEASQSGLQTMLNDLKLMPTTMKQLAVVQFFSWFALFAMWIYTTSAVTGHIYGSTDTSSALYNEGADWVGLCFAMYNGVSALAAFALPWLAARTSRKFVHAACLVLGGISLATMALVQNPTMLMLNMVGIGFAWASILCMPYAILAGSIPSSKMGFFMGVFNFFIVIPQVLAAGILGYMTQTFFGGNAMIALVLGGGSMALAAVCTLLVSDQDDILPDVSSR